MADTSRSPVIVAATRTPIGRFLGGLSPLSAPELGSIAIREAVRRGARLRVATKYLHTAREHFAEKGMHVDLIKLYGSMELAPLVGLADAIVDLVSSGSTLRANQLKAVEEIVPISARLIINQATLKLKRETIQPMLDAFSNASAQRSTSQKIPEAAHQ